MLGRIIERRYFQGVLSSSTQLPQHIFVYTCCKQVSFSIEYFCIKIGALRQNVAAGRASSFGLACEEEPYLIWFVRSTWPTNLCSFFSISPNTIIQVSPNMFRSLNSPLRSSLRRFLSAVNNKASKRSSTSATCSTNRSIVTSAGSRMNNASKVIAASSWTLLLASLLLDKRPAESQAQTQNNPNSDEQKPNDKTAESNIDMGEFLEEMEESSSDATEHPAYPGLFVLTAYDLRDILHRLNNSSNNTNYFVEIYSQDCPACAMYSPIVRTAARILHDTNQSQGAPALKICLMEETDNFLPGFLSAEEENRLPVFKLIPANNNNASPSNKANDTAAAAQSHSNPQRKSGTAISSLRAGRAFDISQLLKYLHMHCGGCFDLQAALDRIPAYEAQLNREILAATKQRLSEASSSTALYANSPCGEHQIKFMQHNLASEFMRESPEVEAVDAELHRKFMRCMEGKLQENIDYWQEIEQHAALNVNSFNAKLKNQQQKNSKSSDNSPTPTAQQP
jgi:hypothetical protein